MADRKRLQSGFQDINKAVHFVLLQVQRSGYEPAQISQRLDKLFDVVVQ